jgi:hypothetical protein
MEFLTDYFQIRVERRKRVGANPNIERRCILNPATDICAPITQLIWTKAKRNLRCLTRLDGDALESLQLAHWARIASPSLVDVKLDHLITSNPASIGHIGNYGHGLTYSYL